jgi:hypothetical protein
MVNRSAISLPSRSSLTPAERAQCAALEQYESLEADRASALRFRARVDELELDENARKLAEKRCNDTAAALEAFWPAVEGELRRIGRERRAEQGDAEAQRELAENHEHARHELEQALEVYVQHRHVPGTAGLIAKSDQELARHRDEQRYWSSRYRSTIAALAAPRWFFFRLRGARRHRRSLVRRAHSSRGAPDPPDEPAPAPARRADAEQLPETSP